MLMEELESNGKKDQDKQVNYLIIYQVLMQQEHRKESLIDKILWMKQVLLFIT